MKVAITSTVVLEVPDSDTPLDELRVRFLEANRVAINIPMETLTGQSYTLRAIERFEITWWRVS